MKLIQSMTVMAVVLAARTADADTIYVCWDAFECRPCGASGLGNGFGPGARAPGY